MSREFGIDTSPRTKYVVYNYPADGDARCERCEVQFDTFAEAKDDALCRVGAATTIEPWRVWDGHEADDSGLIAVEAYHDSQEPLCGGVQISKFDL